MATTAATPQWLTIPDVARLAGCSQADVWRAIRRGALRAVSASGRPQVKRVAAAEYERWRKAAMR